MSPPRKNKTEIFLAFAFGVAFIVVMLVIAIRFPNPTPNQYLVFRVVLALAAAGVASMIPGFLEVEVSKVVRAGGALGVFVVVYFLKPAAIVATPPDHVSITLPSGMNLKTAATFMADRDQLTAVFDSSCKKEFLLREVRAGEVSGADWQELIRSVSLRTVGVPEVRQPWQVTRVKDRGVYEIRC
jgi:hypothetical protein